MVAGKTSSFAVQTARLMQLFSKNTQNFVDFSLMLGYCMQVKNDYCILICPKVKQQHRIVIELNQCGLLFSFAFSVQETHMYSVKTSQRENSALPSYTPSSRTT